jgi:hypothetical protein
LGRLSAQKVRPIRAAEITFPPGAKRIEFKRGVLAEIVGMDRKEFVGRCAFA